MNSSPDQPDEREVQEYLASFQDVALEPVVLICDPDDDEVQEVSPDRWMDFDELIERYGPRFTMFDAEFVVAPEVVERNRGRGKKALPCFNAPNLPRRLSADESRIVEYLAREHGTLPRE